jgi:hypothetical protein
LNAGRTALGLDQRVAGGGVQVYFHQYEIVVTPARALQATFMHMKEAGLT